MAIQIDTREKPKAIEQILKTFDGCGVQYFRSKLFVGDYLNMDNPKVVVDRKQNLLEVASNIVQDRKRFVAEIERANAAGIHVIFLVEHGGKIDSLGAVADWYNPRLKESPMAVSGERLFKIMSAMQNYYGIEWQFCKKADTGMKILELLGGVQDG